jgi:hypothetical protein
LLVTIFARYLDNNVMNLNLTPICQHQDAGSGQITYRGWLYRSPGFAKIAPWLLANRDSFQARHRRVTGFVTGLAAQPTQTTPNHRAVGCN